MMTSVVGEPTEATERQSSPQPDRIRARTTDKKSKGHFPTKHQSKQLYQHMPLSLLHKYDLSSQPLALSRLPKCQSRARSLLSA